MVPQRHACGCLALKFTASPRGGPRTPQSRSALRGAFRERFGARAYAVTGGTAPEPEVLAGPRRQGAVKRGEVLLGGQDVLAYCSDY